MLAPIAWRVPPRHYGPWEQIASLLTEGLVARGVDVTLFATADSQTRSKLAAICPRPYAEDPSMDAKVWECLHIAHCFERAEEFDIIHNHFDFLPLSYSRLVQTPVVTTIHGFSSERILPVYEKYDRHCHYVSISQSDRHPRLHTTATIHHGIAIDDFPFVETPEDYLLFFGRIHPDKGAAEAIDVARRAGCRLLLAGLIQDESYYSEWIAPHIDGDRVQYLGSAGPERRATLLGNAAALLHLINFDEPFGLSVVEAMACGTPVIATNRGSMPELIRDRENGFLVNSPDEAIDAVRRIPALHRPSIRQYAQKHFGADRMVDEYLRLYHQILKTDNEPPGTLADR